MVWYSEPRQTSSAAIKCEHLLSLQPDVVVAKQREWIPCDISYGSSSDFRSRIAAGAFGDRNHERLIEPDLRHLVQQRFELLIVDLRDDLFDDLCVTCRVKMGGIGQPHWEGARQKRRGTQIHETHAHHPRSPKPTGDQAGQKVGVLQLLNAEIDADCGQICLIDLSHGPRRGGGIDQRKLDRRTTLPSSGFEKLPCFVEVERVRLILGTVIAQRLTWPRDGRRAAKTEQ